MEVKKVGIREKELQGNRAQMQGQGGKNNK